nr:3-deoxy-8-phosphooctulonate synthase [Ignavibacterium sp.]
MSIKLNQIVLGDNKPFVLIAGPCVVENEKMIFETAQAIQKITSELRIPFIFKSSFKKANRTNLKSFTGLGDEESIAILKKLKDELNLSIVTDIHTESDVKLVGD